MGKKSGTTTVGILGKDFVLLAAESKATAGYLVASKEAKKIYKINDRIAASIAGSVGDSQMLIRILKAEAKLYELENKAISVEALATLLSNLMQGSRIFPYITEVLLAGFDKKGFHIFDVDALGGVIEEKRFVATGSGSPLALGVLESEYRENLSKEEAIELATRAIRAAMERDVFSGGKKIEMLLITREGMESITKEVRSELVKA